MKTNYKKGDVIVWSGHEPCIGRLDTDMSAYKFKRCYYVDKEHNSLSYLFLRLATKEEIKLLGKERKLLFKNTK